MFLLRKVRKHGRFRTPRRVGRLPPDTAFAAVACVLTGVNAILIAATELAAVRAVRAAGAVPQAGGAAPGSTTATTSTQAAPPVDNAKPTPATAPWRPPVVGASGSVYRCDVVCDGVPAGPVNPAAEAVLPVDPGAYRIRPTGELRTYEVMRRQMELAHGERPLPERPVVKIRMIRTDTYRKGAMLDLFC